ncbi:MAG: hypothetical protein HY863_13180 [Chloroflexi bacterium]|nr:hypothetical protein [Chloroflexota bacterium]
MEKKKTLTSEEISAIVDRIADEFASEDKAEIKIIATLPPNARWLVGIRKAEAIRADLRNKLVRDFPELSMPEINMKILRSLTPVRIGKSYTEPAYQDHFG